VRLTGWILLLIGLLLCATIVWATVGFLLMGVGLIALQVAERRRTKLMAAGTKRLAAPLVGAGLQPPTLSPDIPPPPRQPRRVAWPAKSESGPYDKEAWRRLIEGDPDLAQLASVLADYGQQYVDELAISYLAAPDKGRLGAIVDGIIARARRAQPPPAPTPGPPPLPQPVIAAGDTRPVASRPPVPGYPADALAASLIVAIEEARTTAEHVEPKPAPVTRREPAFRNVPVETQPVRSPQPLSSVDLTASLTAAAEAVAGKHSDPPKPVPAPESPVVTTREPDIGIPPTEPRPAPTAGAPANDLDQSLLAALAEISGAKPAGPPPIPAPKDPPGPRTDEDPTDLIEKFAPDSSFLRKQ
jgi:hypothetical protein